MKNKLVIFFTVCSFLFSFAQSQEKSEKIVYKWIKEGMVNYGHIKPSGVKDFARLDGKGIEIKEIGERFDEVVEIKRLPERVKPNLDNIDEKNDKQLEDSAYLEKLQKKKNCEVSRKNLEKVDGGDPYMQDASGDLFKLNEEQVSQKKKQIEKDIDYYCSE